MPRIPGWCGCGIVCIVDVGVAAGGLGQECYPPTLTHDGTSVYAARVLDIKKRPSSEGSSLKNELAIRSQFVERFP